MIRVLLADDQMMLRAGLRTILSASGGIAVVGEAADGRQAVEEARRLRPDVVLMDVRMPGMDGIQAISQLAALGLDPPVRVLVLTTFDLDEYVYAALRVGASGFLLKDAPSDELIRAIGVVAAGDAMLAPSVTRRLIQAFATRSQPPNRPGEPALTISGEARLKQLTEREREVLKLLARGLTNMEIAKSLTVSETTVKTHVGRVLTKLGLHNRSRPRCSPTKPAWHKSAQTNSRPARRQVSTTMAVDQDDPARWPPPGGAAGGAAGPGADRKPTGPMCPGLDPVDMDFSGTQPALRF